MIFVHFNIGAPWSDRWSSIKCWNGAGFLKHKFYEVQITKTSDLINFNFRITIKQDHPGIFIEFGLLGYCIDFSYYDNRHWDYTNNCFEKI
jgi:hypothetical protein